MNVCWKCGTGPRGIENGVCQICGNDEDNSPMNAALEQARREQRDELEQEALAAVELRARLPSIVTEAVARLLEEADDLEHARELAGLETTDAKEDSEYDG